MRNIKLKSMKTKSKETKSMKTRSMKAKGTKTKGIKTKSIKTKITLVITLICVCLGAGIGFYSIIQSSNTITENTTNQMTILAKQVGKTVENALDSDFSYLEGIVTDPLISSVDAVKVEQKEFLMSLVTGRGAKEIGVADKNGRTLTSDMKTYADISDADYFKTAMSGKRSVSDPFEDPANPGSMIMQIAVPIYSNGMIVGVLYMTHDGGYLSSITNQILFGETGTAYMINSEGTNIAHFDMDRVMNQQNAITQNASDAASASLINALQTVLQNGNGYSVYEYEGVKKCIGYSNISEYNWHVIVSASYDEMYAGTENIKSGVTIITLAAIVIFSILGFFITGNLIAPVIRVKEELERIAEGDFSKEIPVKLIRKKDETGVLARALKKTQDSLKEALDKVNNQAERVMSYANEQSVNVKALLENVENVSATTEELSASSEETAASTAQMTTAANEAQKAVENIAGRAQDGARTAAEISDRANELQNSSMESQKNATEMYHQSLKTLQQAIEESKKVEEINQLSNAILSITSQTNLLALNASIEAARAGEAGRGFAVVATEIGKLADDSQQSVNQIMEVTEDVIRSVENLSRCATDILKFLDEIVMADYDKMVNTGKQYKGDAEHVNEMVSDLSATAQELFAMISNIVTAMGEVAMATEESATGATTIAQSNSEIAQKTEEVSTLAKGTMESTEELKSAVSVFKLG